MDTENTHFVFDEGKIIVSPNLQPVVSFLQRIQEEIEGFLGFDKKLESIRKQYLETFDFIQFLSNKLKEHSIDFKYNLSEHPASIAEKLKMQQPVRSKMIVLFANLEVLLCINIAYENKSHEEGFIVSKAMDQKVVKSFYEGFCLSEENEWGRKNPERRKQITADELRKLRNSLTHFFSVAKGIQVADALLDDKSRKLEQLTKFKAKFISPEDLYGIIEGCGTLMIQRWSQDCKESLTKNSNEFKEKILCVKALIESSGSIIIEGKQFNL